MTIETFFVAVLAESLAATLEREGLGPTRRGQTRHWLVIKDAAGVEMTEATEDGLPPHASLDSLIRQDGVEGAAYVTQHSGDEIVAQAVVRDGTRLNSDLRRTRLIRTPQGVTVGPWEDAVS